MKKLSFYLRLFSIGFVFGTSLTTVICFLLAYFNPRRAVLLDINIFGEANLEFVMILVGIPCLFWFLKDAISNLGKEEGCVCC